MGKKNLAALAGASLGHLVKVAGGTQRKSKPKKEPINRNCLWCGNQIKSRYKHCSQAHARQYNEYHNWYNKVRLKAIKMGAPKHVVNNILPSELKTQWESGFDFEYVAETLVDVIQRDRLNDYIDRKGVFL